jgi:hypothetical protein
MIKPPAKPPRHLRERERVTLMLSSEMQVYFTKHKCSPRDFLEAVLLDLTDDSGDPTADERYWLQRYFIIWRAQQKDAR